MKNALITTLCTWASYGSVLQSYALKKQLEKLECDSFTVTDYKERETAGRLFSKNPKIFIKNLYGSLNASKRHRRFIKSSEFISSNLDVRRYDSYEDIKKLNIDADICIAGSDQIFNPDVCSPVFFLDFCPAKKRVSYAASMGVTAVKKEKEEEFARLVNNFDRISVREADNAEVIGKYYSGKIDINIDPTFFLSAEEWRKLEKKYDIKGKYIFVYPLYWNKKYNPLLKKLKKETGYEIVTIKNGWSSAYGSKTVSDAGIEEFLWLIDHAEAIVTSSFHGVALSSILNKDFSAVINPSSPSRISSLLQTLGITPPSIEELTRSHIDYETVNKKIEEEKAKGIGYLKEILTDE